MFDEANFVCSGETKKNDGIEFDWWKKLFDSNLQQKKRHDDCLTNIHPVPRVHWWCDWCDDKQQYYACVWCVWPAVVGMCWTGSTHFSPSIPTLDSSQQQQQRQQQLSWIVSKKRAVHVTTQLAIFFLGSTEKTHTIIMHVQFGQTLNVCYDFGQVGHCALG